MTDHQRLLVAMLSEATDADGNTRDRDLTASAVMAMLYSMGGEDARPKHRVPAPASA
jgi:hypothetical protein